jgi:Kef-type K+ transport system membrane component KefB
MALAVGVMAVLLWLAWRFLHRWRIPVSWPWVMGYAVVIVGATEIVYHLTKHHGNVPIHIEVLLPAFVLGCVMMRPEGADPHVDDRRSGHQEGPESPAEQKASTIVSGAFMLFLTVDAGKSILTDPITAQQPMLGFGTIMLHVLVVTIIANLGKMYPALCYRNVAHRKERLALAVGLWPRGEVGAGIVVISLEYGVGGPIVTVAVLCLAANLLLTGVFIWFVKKLLREVPPEWNARAR